MTLASVFHAGLIEADGEIRDGAWVAEATELIDLSAWPEGSRVILRKERPHPGAQLTFTDADGHRITAFLTDTPHRHPHRHTGHGPGPGVVPGQVAGLELRHRQHARVEDRIREAKATGLRNLPCRGFSHNAAWLETVLCAVDLVCWTKLICFHDIPELARCEIAASATGSCTSPPASPAAHDTYGSASTRPGAGRSTSPPASTDSAPPSPDHPATRPRPRNTKHRHRRDSRNPDLPAPNQTTDTAVTPAISTPREKSRLVVQVGQGLADEPDGGGVGEDAGPPRLGA